MNNMTKAERFEYILKLESGQRERKLEQDLATAKRMIKQETIQAQINIITSQVTIMGMAALLAVDL